MGFRTFADGTPAGTTEKIQAVHAALRLLVV